MRGEPFTGSNFKSTTTQPVEKVGANGPIAFERDGKVWTR